jgi:hypothetical protein
MIIAGAYCDAIGRVDLAAGHGQPIAVEDVLWYFHPPVAMCLNKSAQSCAS